jgi:putative salt-induced outer membrane protein YdiY
VSAKLANGISMKVSLKLDHNTEVDEGRDNLDTETSVTLVYTFF